MPGYPSNVPDIGQVMPSLMAIEGIQGRQSQERIDYNVRTQVLVQLAQWAGVIFGICSIGAGLFLLARSLVWVVAQFDEVTAILAAGVIGAFLLICGYAMHGVFDLAGWHERAWRSSVQWIAATTVTLLALSVIQAVAEGWDWKRGVGILLGVGAVFAGVLLTWRLGNELRNPMYPAPPVIDLFRDWLAMQAETQPTPAPGVRFVRVANAGQVRAVAVGEGPLTPDEADLLYFVQESAVRGLSRSAWVGPGVTRFMLPVSGREVTKAVYSVMIHTLGRMGYVRLGTDGAAHAWAPGYDALTVLDDLERQAAELAEQE